ncbi:MAG: glycoside hydrolase family 88 protein [Lachnospiraceae bacterium]|nr:glycoside hydrolase family 88 protein [Lachnospiraceae bacterium]
MDRIEKYIDELLAKSTPDRPAWNIEKILQGLKSNWNYIDGCMIKAVLEMYAITGNQKYFAFADAFIDAKVREDGTIDGYSVEELNIDNVNAGKTLFELYDLTGKEKYRKAIDLVYSQIEQMPRTQEGSFWHKNIYPNQVWLDGLYMCQPFYMEYETRFDEKKKYDDIFRQFFTVQEKMRDPKTGLYYHAWDSSRQMFWCDRVTGLSQNFWLRALGWFSMALLDTLDKTDASAAPEAYGRMKGMFVDLMDALLRYQDESGMWYQVVNFGGMEKNYLETSGSSILAYALLKGVRLGFLPESYREAGVKAFNGVCGKYLSEDENGSLHLGGICLVAGLGGKGNRPGTYDYYMSEPVVKDDAKGVGPFLLAYTEMRRAGRINEMQN